MNLNPYESSKTADVVPQVCRSRRPYLIASLVVLSVLVVLAAFVGCYTEAYTENGELIFHIPDRVSSTPLGDPLISYDRLLLVPVRGVAIVCAIVVAATLGGVNGLIFCWRR